MSTAKPKRIGRPPVKATVADVVKLRTKKPDPRTGRQMSWPAIAAQLGISERTAKYLWEARDKG